MGTIRPVVLHSVGCSLAASGMNDLSPYLVVLTLGTSVFLSSLKLYIEALILTLAVVGPTRVYLLGFFCFDIQFYLLLKVSKGAKIRSRYNQVPHLTQDTNRKVTNSQLDTTNESQEISSFTAGDHKAHINRRTKA